MNVVRLRWLALVAAVVVLTLGYLSLTRTVTVLADGQVIEVVSRAVTVGGVLDAAGVTLGPRDRVTPGGFSLAADNMVIAVDRATRVQLLADGQVRVLETGESNPTIILAQLGLDLEPGDRLMVAGKTISLNEELPDSPALLLELKRAVTVTLNVDGETRELLTSAPTVGQALADNGVSLTAADMLEPSAETPLSDGMTVVLQKAAPVRIRVEGEELEAFTAAKTVGEALADAGLALQGLDFSEPAAEDELPADGEIRVVRVRESVVVEQEIVPHDTDFQADPEAELDTTSIVQEGQDGLSATRLRVRYEDGEEVSRAEEALRVFVEPKTGITGYGTKIVIKTAVVDGVTIEYYRAVNVFATYYTPCRSGVDSCLYGTSSGLPLQRGVVATYLNWYRELKLASVYVTGYGPGTIADVGAWPDRSVPWIDLAFSDAEAEANDPPWSNGYVTMYFTTPVPFYVPPIWPP